MQRHLIKGWTKKRLRFVLLLLFMALAIPTVILIIQASRQIKWESFHLQRIQAEALTAQLDQRYTEILASENARPFTDYSYLNVVGDQAFSQLKQSPLSAFPVRSQVPGVMGYFQIGSDGNFSSPMLPVSIKQAQRTGLSVEEYQSRKVEANKILLLLKQNRLIASSVHGIAVNQVPGTEKTEQVKRKQSERASKNAGQAGFDQLQSQRPYSKRQSTSLNSSLGRVEDLKLKQDFPASAAESDTVRADSSGSVESLQRSLRKERNILPGPARESEITSAQPVIDEDYRISIFESEIDTLEFAALGSGHFVLFRKVWRDEQRIIQGMLIDSRKFIYDVMQKTFLSSPVSRSSKMLVAHNGTILAAFDTNLTDKYALTDTDLQGTLLHQQRLGGALDQIQLIFSIKQLPAGPGGVIISWMSLIILLVLCTGFVFIYYLGVKQINLHGQQQDFVSAISHELKTPLTSIRMYSEMLREGWATEDKRKSYYDYIHDESERLTRLINNVLQLARMTRNSNQIQLCPYPVSEILDLVEQKLATQVNSNGFILNRIGHNDTEHRLVHVDIDYVIQIMINLVDNAIKFSKDSGNKIIDLGCRRINDTAVQFYVRDYGPGIPRQQAKKIFELFYRSGTELTRETVGTGIGLALVKQMMQSMKGSVDVILHDPGAEFCLVFPSRQQ